MFKKESLILSVILLGPILVGVLIALAVPIFVKARGLDIPMQHGVAIIGLYAVGFGLFLKSKFSVLSEGTLLSFGRKDMSKLHRICYRLGYALMLTAFAYLLSFF